MDKRTADHKLESAEKGVFRLEHCLLVLEHLPIMIGLTMWHGLTAIAHLLAYATVLIIVGLFLVYIGVTTLMRD